MQIDNTLYSEFAAVIAVLIAFVILAFVISEYRRSKSRERLLQLSNEIVDGSAAYIIVLDRNKNILKLNQALSSALQKSEENLNGKTLEASGLSDSGHLVNALNNLSAAVPVKGVTIRDQVLTSGGERLAVDWQISSLEGPHGSIMRYIASGLNVTELERTRLKLQNLRENTEREERRKLAEELHDEIGNYLVISGMKLEELQESFVSASTKNVLDELQETIETIITRTRSLVFELGPMSIEQTGLENTLESLAQHMQNRSGIPVLFKGDKLNQQPEADVTYFIFNSVREIITNAIKHAGASEIRVVVSQQPNSVEVVVEDNGIGFNFKEALEKRQLSKGFGLPRLVERCEFFGVGLKVDTASGCTFRINIPLTFKEANAYSNSVS